MNGPLYIGTFGRNQPVAVGLIFGKQHVPTGKVFPRYPPSVVSVSITPNGVDISAVKQGSSFYGIPSVKLLHPNGFQVGLGLFSPDHVFRKKCKVLSQGRAMVRGTQGDQSRYGMGMVIDVFSGDQPPLTVGDDVKPL